MTERMRLLSLVYVRHHGGYERGPCHPWAPALGDWKNTLEPDCTCHWSARVFPYRPARRV